MTSPPKTTRAQKTAALTDERHFQPRLLFEGDLQTQPSEVPTPERRQAAQAWQALQIAPEDALTDRQELEKLDRGLLAARRQVYAAKQQGEALKAELAQVREQRYPAAAVYGLGALALAAGCAWVYERRRALSLEQPEPSTGAMTSAYANSESVVHGADSMDPWLEPQPKMAEAK